VVEGEDDGQWWGCSYCMLSRWPRLSQALILARVAFKGRPISISSPECNMSDGVAWMIGSSKRLTGWTRGTQTNARPRCDSTEGRGVGGVGAAGGVAYRDIRNSRDLGAEIENRRREKEESEGRRERGTRSENGDYSESNVLTYSLTRALLQLPFFLFSLCLWQHEQSSSASISRPRQGTPRQGFQSNPLHSNLQIPSGGQGRGM